MSAGVKPLQVSPLIKSARYLSLALGILYGIMKHSALKAYEATALPKRKKYYAEKDAIEAAKIRAESKAQMQQLANDFDAKDLPPDWEDDYL